MTSVLITHTVPLLAGGMIFSQWLPERAEDTIRLNHEGIDIHVRLDRACIESMQELTDELVRTWSNMPVARLYVDVRFEHIAADLAAFIRDNADWPRSGPMPLDSPDPETRRLGTEYQNLGVRVLRAVLQITNRIVAWTYAERGQYWLEERDIEKATAMMMSRNNEFNARASIDSGPLVRWCPPSRDRGVAVAHLNGLKSDDWHALGRFLQGERSPGLVGQLLSNAEALLALGHNRSALIEAVSALEVALQRFAAHSSHAAWRDKYNVLGTQPSERLAKTVDHLGFSASVTYLLPLILENLPAQAYATSCEAIKKRGAVVHGREREVSHENARRYLTGLRQLANLLLESARVEDTTRGGSNAPVA